MSELLDLFHNQGRGVPIGGGKESDFLPSNIAGLQLWIDFSDVSTLYQDAAKSNPVTSDGDVIGAAEDLSGKGNDATEVTNKPTYKTNIQGGLSVGRGDGLNDSLSGVLGIALNDTYSLFITLKTAVVDGTGRHVMDIRGTASSVIALRHVIGSQDWFNRYNDGSVPVTQPQIDLGNSFIVFSGINNLGALEVWKNGISQGTQSISGNGILGSGPFYLFNGSGGALAAIVDIGEICLYNVAISSENKLLMESYLSNKWAI